MKDAKGHGSNPRGAHAEGVDQIGKPQGAPLDRDGNPLVDMNGTPVRADSDGMLTLYHHTTPEAADAIRRTGRFTSLENTNETFFSTQLHGQGEGYGDAVVTARVRPQDTRINDAFHNGEVHVAVSNTRLSKRNVVR